MQREPELVDSADRQLLEGVLRGERRALAKTITLLESCRSDHRARAQRLLAQLLPHSGNSLRVGISGVPGVGKSTFIEALGLHLIGQGHRVAVLAVDPSSSVSGGSILGDKTRMERLSHSQAAFIRPSPTSGALGGVAAMTREAMLACEAAGFDVVIVETVGVGQSETAVAGMVDAFVLLLLPNAGDELQAIKRGIMELADLLVINKADSDVHATARTRSQVRSALALLHPAAAPWQPPVHSVSAIKDEGIAEFWADIERFRACMSRGGEFGAKRRRQALAWMATLIDAGLRQGFHEHPRVRADLERTRLAVEAGAETPSAAAQRLLSYLQQD